MKGLTKAFILVISDLRKMMKMMDKAIKLKDSVDSAGMLPTRSKIHCFPFVNAVVVLDSYITSV